MATLSASHRKTKRKVGTALLLRPLPARDRDYCVVIVDDGVWLPPFPWIMLLPSEMTWPLLIVRPAVLFPVIVLPNKRVTGAPPACPLNTPKPLLVKVDRLTEAAAVLASIASPAPLGNPLTLVPSIVAEVRSTIWMPCPAPCAIVVLSTVSCTLPAAGLTWIPSLLRL